MCVTFVLVIIRLEETALVGVVILSGGAMVDGVELAYFIAHCLPERPPIVLDVLLGARNVLSRSSVGLVIIEGSAISIEVFRVGVLIARVPAAVP